MTVFPRTLSKSSLSFPHLRPGIPESRASFALVVGLANRHCYTTGTRVISEAVDLPDLPGRFRELGQVVLAGDLRDGLQLAAACERLWQGLNVWSEDYGYQIISQERIPF